MTALKITSGQQTDIREPMRSLLQRLSLGSKDSTSRIIAFIAARSREGTSTVATRYAETLAAESGQKLLLIDAGRLMPKRFEALAIDPMVGIVDTMIAGLSPKEAIHSVGKDRDMAIGRWMVHDENRAAAGKLMNHPDFWKALLASYDSIVIDAPSLQSSFDGVMLAARADTAVMVVEAEKTPQAVVMHLRDTLIAAGANVAGVVMNKRRFYIPKRVYEKL